jgi:hypothetical protein
MDKKRHKEQKNYTRSYIAKPVQGGLTEASTLHRQATRINLSKLRLLPSDFDTQKHKHFPWSSLQNGSVPCVPKTR